jgi:antitoxin YefM
MSTSASVARMESQAAADFGADTSASLERVRTTRHPLILTQNGKDVAVVVDIESYQKLVDSLALHRDIRLGLADVEAGRVVAHEDVRALLQGREQQAGDDAGEDRRQALSHRAAAISEEASKRRLGLYRGRMRLQDDIHASSEDDWNMLG